MSLSKGGIVDDHLIPYFTAEKQEALLFMVVGLVAIAVSVWLWVRGGQYKSAVYPLVAIAAIQLVVGSTVYFRTDSQVAALTAQYESDPMGFQMEETQRMNVVVQNFVLYRYIEIALLLIGIYLMLGLRHQEIWHAVGVGLTVQAALMLGLDYFAERRADEYLKFVLGG